MKNIFLIVLVLFCLSNTYAQIGIKSDATTPIPSAQLEVQSTTKAFYPPRMTTVQKNAIVRAEAGATVFDTDLNGLFVFNGTSWVASGLTLPYLVSQNSLSDNLLSLENTNTNASSSTIFGGTVSVNGSLGGVTGFSYNTAPSGNPSGVRGLNFSNNANGYGVYGSHSGTGSGVYGNGTSNGVGVYGISNLGIGGYFTSVSGNSLITGTGNVGIGIPAPLEKLHVSGNIRVSSLSGPGVRDVKADANGTLITTPQTYTVSISPQSFQPRYNNSGTFTSSGAFGDCYMSVGSTDNLIAGISLPNGVTVTSVIIYYINLDSSKRFDVNLKASPFATTFTFDVFNGITSTVSSSGNNVVSYSIPNSGGGSVINNSSNYYYLLVYPQTLAGGSTTWSANMSIKGVKITYTL